MALTQIANWLFQNSMSTRSLRYRLTLLCCLCLAIAKPQVANYISNGGFEDLYSCTWPNDISKAKHWMSIDSNSFAGNVISSCPGYDLVPNCGYTFQYPRSGDNYAISGWYFPTNSPERGYFKNRLKNNLEAGKTYCVKLYVNISDNSTYGMDGFGIYFGGSQIDTITHSTIPLTFISPQVHRLLHNPLIDTLNWTLVTGTFVANGNEKYALIGNFISNASIDTVFFNPTNLPLKFTDVCVDDVSCIPIDLPPFAGNDTTSVGSNSVYIGRPRDIGIDEDCMWYKLPMVITPTTPAIDTAAGIWVCPPITSTYVVRQEICGYVKWDTVVVWKGTVGIDGYNADLRRVSFYPNPATDVLSVTCADAKDNESFRIIFCNGMGSSIKESDIIFKNERADIDVSELSSGVYFVTICDRHGVKENRKLRIDK